VLPSLPVKTFYISAFTFRRRAIQVDEQQFLTHNLGYQLPVSVQWRDKTSDADHVSFYQQTGDVACTPDVLRAVFVGKPQVGIQSCPQFIAIQQHDISAKLFQLFGKQTR